MKAGYKTNLVNRCLWDVEQELKECLENGGAGSALHYELSERLKTISTLACSAARRKDNKLI